MARSTRLLSIILIGISCALNAGAQTKAYLTHAGTTNLATVIDTAPDVVLRTILLGAGPSRVAITADGSRAYVLQGAGNSIAVIDIASDTVVNTVALSGSPSAIAIAPNGQTAYVGVGNAVQVLSLASGLVTSSVSMNAPPTGLAVTPDGTRLYAACAPDILTLLTAAAGSVGRVSVIDTASLATVTSFVPQMPIPGPGVNVTSGAINVAVSPNGKVVYVGVEAAYSSNFGFSTSGGIAAVDSATNAILQIVDLRAIPLDIAFTPDSSRAYVGIQSVWVNEGQVAAAIPGHTVAVLDTSNHAVIGAIDLGADGLAYSQQNYAQGIAVTPDRSEIYVAIPRLNSVAVVGVNTGTIRQLIPVAASPNYLAIVPAAVPLVPYLIQAVDDNPAASISSPIGGTAVASVLTNDTLGAAQATLSNVTIEQLSTTNTGISLNTATGRVSVAPGMALGTYSLVYKICDKTLLSNCAQANVVVTVRAPYLVDAVDDSASSLVGRLAIPNVLSNDTFNGGAATLTDVTLSAVSSSNPGLALSAQGAVSIATGTPVGAQTLVYRICEIAEASNCDIATVRIQVLPSVIHALNDSGTITRAGGLVIASVLANDTFNGAVATLPTVTLTQVSSTDPGVTLNTLDGSVSVAPATPAAAQTLSYRICETATPANCDSATVAVTVNPYVIRAVNDSAPGFSNLANTALRSVLENDTLGGAPATTSNVTLSLISLSPANSQIQLDLVDGGVKVLGPTTPGKYLMVYRICETGNAGNCSQATVSITLTVNTTTTFRISISKNGKGTVTTSPTGTSFAVGTVVKLTATPDPGQPWIGWAGACSGTATTCTLTMDSDKSVTANFR